MTFVVVVLNKNVWLVLNCTCACCLSVHKIPRHEFAELGILGTVCNHNNNVVFPDNRQFTLSYFTLGGSGTIDKIA